MQLALLWFLLPSGAAAKDMVAKRHGEFVVHARGGEVSISVPVQGFRDLKLFTLQEPYRIVLDITNDETFYSASNRYGSESAYFKEIRTSHKDGVYRFVAETAPGVKLARYGVLKPIKTSEAHIVLFTITGKNIRATAVKKPTTRDTPVMPVPKSVAVLADLPTAGVKPAMDALAQRSPASPAMVGEITEDGISSPTEIPVPVRKPGSINPIIVIDAGHGGRDPGSRGAHKREKDITLSYAAYVTKHLSSTGRYKARMTRERDVFIPLDERVDIAENLDADFFISLHADSLPSKPNLRGLSIYTLSDNASDREAEALAETENAAGIVHGATDVSDDITDALVRLVQRDTMNRSAFFAEEFVKRVPSGIPVLGNPHRFAGFRVLAGVRVPSALIEMGFMSNARDERMFMSEDHKKAVAVTIEKSLDTLFYKK